ncbi:hypothetical protein [Clostridium sp. YIM B02555]|uniref:hypothetical protein n=1 Tax=Clostridium sp. YIM B02555 TaxID=2911968 RepID=UPI001EED0E49|nr:hypothetical protein [Clostridium sp. YIM B02555]
MQKWQKVFLVILFILAFLGAIIGFIMTYSGFGQINVFAEIDILGFFELILLFVAIICGIVDIYEIYDCIKLFGAKKFKLVLTTKNRLNYILVFFAAISLLEFGELITSKDMHLLPLLFITLILTTLFIIHVRSENGLSDNGIIYCGIYHNLADIKSYRIINNTILELNILINFFWFEYTNIIKFNLSEGDKNNVENFLTKKMQSH